MQQLPSQTSGNTHWEMKQDVPFKLLGPEKGRAVGTSKIDKSSLRFQVLLPHCENAEQDQTMYA